MAISELQRAYGAWLQEGNSFDLAMCLHAPNHVRVAERGFDDGWLKNKLRHYFNCLDRKFYKNQHRKDGKRMKRLVVLGHTDSVGWHAHVSLSLPPGAPHDKCIAMMHVLWLKHMKADKISNTAFKHKLFWAEPMKADYINYSLGNAKDILGTHSGIHHGNSQAHSHGTVDIENCHF